MRVGWRIVFGAAAGVAAGLAAGLGLVAVTGTAAAQRAVADDPARLIDAAHLPPLLFLPGEQQSLRYDVYCAPPGTDPESGAPCDAAGTVFVRSGDRGAFRALPLRVDAGASAGRLVADLPTDIARSPDGFSYYAVLRSRTSGASTTLPAGGPFAPIRSRVLAAPVVVRLGPHVFGGARRPSARPATAAWGTGEGQVGLEQSPDLQPIGGASFDVGPSGVVSLLDEANHRLLRFAPGTARASALKLGIRGTIADLAVADDGSSTVLETVGDDGEPPLVRRFDANGRSLGATHVAEGSVSALDQSPGGPVVLGYPAGEWMPVTEGGASLAEAGQRMHGRVGRALANGAELVVEREGGEARIAEVAGTTVRRGWRVLSDTPLGEVQLAKPLGADVLVVVRVGTEDRDEFEVLVLGDAGLVTAFPVASTAWAETAPLARFRLRGASLYELGSTPAGVFVDRFDLGSR